MPDAGAWHPLVGDAPNERLSCRDGSGCAWGCLGHDPKPRHLPGEVRQLLLVLLPGEFERLRELGLCFDPHCAGEKESLRTQLFDAFYEGYGE